MHTVIQCIPVCYTKVHAIVVAKPPHHSLGKMVYDDGVTVHRKFLVLMGCV
jgi:hypothetical protein